MTLISDATIQDIIDAAAEFYSVDPILAKVVAYQKSQFDDKMNSENGVGLFAIEPTTDLSVADLLNPITNAYIGVKALVGTAPDNVTADLVKSVANGSFPPNWTSAISKRTGLTVVIAPSVKAENAVVPGSSVLDTPTPAPEVAPTTPVNDTVPSDQASQSTEDRVRTVLEDNGFSIVAIATESGGGYVLVTIA